MARFGVRRDGFVVYRVKSAGTTHVAIGPADGTSTYEQVGDHGRRAEKPVPHGAFTSSRA